MNLACDFFTINTILAPNGWLDFGMGGFAVKMMTKLIKDKRHGPCQVDKMNKACENSSPSKRLEIFIFLLWGTSELRLDFPDRLVVQNTFQL